MYAPRHAVCDYEQWTRGIYIAGDDLRHARL